MLWSNIFIQGNQLYNYLGTNLREDDEGCQENWVNCNEGAVVQWKNVLQPSAHVPTLKSVCNVILNVATNAGNIAN